MVLDVIWLLVGLALLLGGGDVLVRGAAGLARTMGVSALMIGLTVVAFGTSAPELAVNLMAVYRGEGDISFGNIVGSNIANVGLIVGVAGLLTPLAIEPSIIRREIPMMLLATFAVVVMAIGPSGALLGGGAGDSVIDFLPAQLTRDDGLVLLLLFAVFMYYTIVDAMHRPEAEPAESEVERGKESPVRSLLFAMGGLAAVVGGGHLTVEGAVGVAEAMGISQAVIGLTIVAIGTSLPELATSLSAVRRGHTDMAIGNVVGSNIFNLLLILATTASLSPMPIAVPPGGTVDLLIMAALSLALLPLAMTGKRINRLEAGLLLAAYIGYLTWRILS